MEIVSYLLGTITSTALLAILAFLCKGWFEARIASAIQHEYDKKLLDLETTRDIRLKSEIIAELVSEWIGKKNEYSEFTELNKLSFQAFLWLPAELAVELSDTLSHQDSAEDIRTILIKVRKHLLGKDDNLEPRSIIVFKDKTN